MASLSQRVRRRLEAPGLGLIAVSFAALLISDRLSQWAGDSVLPGGPLDEIAHALTNLLVVWALGTTVSRRMMLPSLIASVAIDVDHIPQHLGWGALTAGTPRPYTHSLLTLLCVLALAASVRSPARRRVLVAVGLGLAIHFWRDLSEPGPGVSLLWPLTDHAYALPHWSYLAALTVLAALLVVARRPVLLRRPGTSSA